jgi:hypothetical protein
MPQHNGDYPPMPRMKPPRQTRKRPAAAWVQNAAALQPAVRAYPRRKYRRPGE